MSEFTFNIKYEKGELFKFMMKVAVRRLTHKFFVSVWLAGLFISWFSWRYLGLSIFFSFFIIFLSLIPVALLLAAILSLTFISHEKRFMDGLELRFTEDKVFWQGKDFKSEVDWSYMKEYLEDLVAFMLFIPHGRYLLLPKRIFESKDQMRKFRELVKSKVKESATSKMISKEVLKQDG